ncbi:hypothetical protein EXIGLDRAFT_707575 [Exidia glandulosa HHB12029]|uniref:Uncharacterized protein n=1 Tax=Exidia glandulosa HHB12029 TaxID=1314781 RepID=A0A166NGY3_EXIGL|nr:hypothetical protein EXIGLDRAFT_707575 [Exidia glandulosa HHB12029]
MQESADEQHSILRRTPLARPVERRADVVHRELPLVDLLCGEVIQVLVEDLYASQPEAYADYASLSSLSPDSLSLSSRSTSSSEKSLHNKRSLSAITPLSVNVEEPASYDDPPSSAVDLRNPNGTPFDDPDMGYGQDPTGSPVDGSGGSSGEHRDDAKPMDGVVQNGMYGYNVLGGGGKAPTSNNFVTKLYRALSASQPEAYADYASLSSLSPDSLSLSSGSSSAYSEVGTPPDDMCSSLHGHGTSSVMPPYGVRTT